MKLVPRFTGLRLWQKLIVIAAALGLPAVALAVFYIGSMSYDGRFVKAELDGLEYIEPLDRLNESIAAQRGMLEAHARWPAAQEAFRGRIAETRARIDEAIKQADAADAKYGAKFGTSERWKQFKLDWAVLRERGTDLKAEQVSEKYAKLAADMLAVHTDVSEKSNLILDPILVTYYLQDNVTLRVLPIVDFVAQSRAAAFEMATKKEATLADRFKLAELLGQVSAARAGFDGNVTVLKDRDPAAYARLAPRFLEATAVADAYVALLQKQMIEVSAEGGQVALVVNPAEVWDKGTAALDAYSKVNDEDLPILRGMLNDRYSAANNRIYLSAALISLALLVAGALVYAIAFGIARQTTSITRALGAVKAGNPDARAEVSASDELGEVAAGLNAMLDATARLIQSQGERDQIQTSIMKLLDEVGGVAQGDLTTEAEVTADITGAIADAFNYMIAQLRQIIGSVQKATRQVTGSAGEIYESTRSLATGAEDQAAQIAAAKHAVEDVAASVRLVSENAVLSAAVAQQSLANARQGTESVKNTIAGMGRIRDQVQETAKRIKRLGESSQEIGQIIRLIDDIADRTSILALNASIQAAMAGEAGRGFAVVAEEVERLADRSTDATKKIAALVKAIQGETTEAVSAMEKGIQEVVEGSKLAAQAGQALDEIEGVSGKLAGLIQGISEASRQQAHASDGVTRAMTDISGITEQTTSGTRQAAAAVQGLAELAEGLRASVAAFKLPAGTAEAAAPEAPAARVEPAGRNRPNGTNGHRKYGTNGHSTLELLGSRT